MLADARPARHISHLGVQESRVKAARLILSHHNLTEFRPEEIIEMALKHKPYVAFSGGKASLVVLHQVLKYAPDVPVVFNNTGVELPGTEKYVRELAKDWRLNYTELRAPVTFWDIVKTKEDWPHPPTVYMDRKPGEKGGKPKCCVLLKEKPVKEWQKTSGVDCVFLGIQACESRNRMFLIGDYGQFPYVKSSKFLKAYPIAFWTDKDIWDYIGANKLPYNPNYDRGYERTGCWPCTSYRNWHETLARCDPRMLDFILKKRGEPGLLAFMGSKMEKELHPECDER